MEQSAAMGLAMAIRRANSWTNIWISLAVLASVRAVCAALDRHITHATSQRPRPIPRGTVGRIAPENAENSRRQDQLLEKCPLGHPGRLHLQPGHRQHQQELEEHEDDEGREDIA